MTDEQGVQVQPEETPAAPAPEPKVRKPRQTKTEEPTVGRTVHYITDSGKPRPAVLIDVHGEGLVDLVIFNPLGAVPKEEVEFSEAPEPGFWTWPPRS